MLSKYSKKNSKQVLWTIIGNGSYGLSQFLSIILIGRMLGIKDIGIYSLAIALTTPILLFLNLGLRMQLMTDIKLDVPVNNYKVMQLISSCLGLLLLTLICIFFNYSLDVFFVIILVALIKCIEYQSELYYGYLQRNNLNKTVSKSLFFKSCLSILTLTCGILITEDLIKSLMCVLFVILIFSLIYDRKNILSKVGLKKSEKLNKNNVLKILNIGIPLSLSAFLISMNVNVPRLVLGNVNLEQLGYFASVFAFMQIGTLLIMSLGQVLSGKMAKNYFNKEYKVFFRIATYGVLISFGIGVIGVIISFLLGHYILDLVVGYKGNENIMFYVFLFAPFQYMMTMFGYINGASRQSKSLFMINLPIFLIVSTLSLLLIPNNGITGAVWSMLISFVVGSSIYLYVLKRNFKRLIEL